MNNQKKGVFIVLYFGHVIYENKSHIPLLWNGFWRWCIYSFAIKSTFKNRNIIKQHIRFLAVTFGITICGSPVKLLEPLLIAISILYHGTIPLLQKK
jgi:hypothetical protein